MTHPAPSTPHQAPGRHALALLAIDVSREVERQHMVAARGEGGADREAEERRRVEALDASAAVLERDEREAAEAREEGAS